MDIEKLKKCLNHYENLTLKETQVFRKEWIKIFAKEDSEIPMHKCPNCKDYQNGDFIGYDWHGISYDENSKAYECEDYVKALNDIRNKYNADIIIFEENCVSSGIVVAFIDLMNFFNSNLSRNINFNDVYFTPKDYSWTLIITHESGWIGPFLKIRKIK